jgi:Asp-tRNA(Asn)/Glu-tRNA(Gln) amidotransferase A subunit family amidase
MKEHLTFSEWRGLAPAEVAREVHERAGALRAGQREAVFAMLACEEEIAGRLEAGTARSELAGVPFVVKDLFDAAGWTTKAGSTFLEEERGRPETDGALVKTLRDAGAVLAAPRSRHQR